MKINKKPQNLIIAFVSILILLFCILIFCASSVSGILASFYRGSNENISAENTPTEEVKGVEVTPEVEKESVPISYKVVSVTDGDTIKIDLDGTIEKVRMIGIDAPESTTKKECFGIEASNYLKSLLSDKEVYIEPDPTQDVRDKYGRLLLYIYLDGKNINGQMIKQGYAHEYTYNVPYKFQAQFKQAQKDAEASKLGLWGDVCNSPTPTPTPKVVYTPIPIVVYTPVPTIAPTQAPSYTCNCSKTCTQIYSCSEAYYQLNVCGCRERDGDNDGIPCESLCR